MKDYHLTLEERILFKAYIAEGYNQSKVAQKLDRDKSTISRELKKWGISGDLKISIKDYDPHLAHWFKIDGKAIVKKYECKLKRYPKLLKKVLLKLSKRWSPEQISNWLKKHYKNLKHFQVSHETIYNFIYKIANPNLKIQLISCLRRAKKIRKTPKKRTKGSTIKDRVSIDCRPTEVDSRGEIGHWEGDLIIGLNKKNVIGTLVERKTRFTIIVKPKSKKSKDVVKAFVNAFKKIPAQYKKSLTYDNGTEMAQHKSFTKNTGMPVFFCHPYSSWERGTNENTNGLIRDFWPKKTSFEALSNYAIKRVQKLLNDRPRKILNWCSPNELFVF